MNSFLSRLNPLRSDWDPFRELGEFENRLARWFGRPMLTKNGGEKETLSVAEWAPPVDITEDEKEFLIKAELPELKKEEVKVSVESGQLIITGERKLEKEDTGKKFHRIERSYGSFLRSFSLPAGVNGDKVHADFKDGLLTIHLPKDEKVKPRSIDVKVG